MSDYSFIAGSAPPPINPLQTLSGWQDYANKVQQNKNMQQELANAQLANQTGQQALASTMANRHAQILYGLSNLPDSELPGAARAALDRELQSGQIDQQRHDVMDQALKENMDNPTAIRRMINGGLATTMAGPEAAKFLMGTPMAVDQGATLQGVIQGGVGSGAAGALIPNGGAVPIGGPTNSQLVGRTPIVGANGEPGTAPLGSVTPPNLLGPGKSVGVPFPAGVRPAPDAGAAATPGQAPGGVPGQAPGGVPGQVATGLPPGSAEAMQTEKTSAAQAGVILTDTDATRPQQQALLSDILTQANVPGAFTGPDAQGWKAAMARFAEVPGVVDEKVKAATSAQDQMEKAMANFQSIAMRGMISTNAGLAQTVAGSPHMELSKGGLEGNVHQLQGTLDAQAVMSNAWQQARANGASAEGFKDWQRKFIAATPEGQFDPRVFWMKRMSPPERQIFVKAANDPNLRLNYNYAVKRGWIQ